MRWLWFLIISFSLAGCLSEPPSEASPANDGSSGPDQGALNETDEGSVVNGTASNQSTKFTWLSPLEGDHVMIVTASGPMDMACDVRVVATVPNDGNNPVFVVRFGSIDYSPEWNAHHAGRDISVQAGSQSVGGSDGGGFVNRRVTVYSDLLLTSSSRESTTITVFAKNAVIDESLGKNGEPWFNVRASVGIRLICPVAPVIEKTYFGDTLELMALSEIDGLAGGNLPDVVGASVGGQLTATVPEEHGIVTLDGISGLSGRVHVATPDNEHTEFVGNGFGFTFAWSGGAGEYAFEATALEYAPSHYFFVAIAGYDDSRFPVLQDPMA